jgi:glutathione S-transferase
MRLFASTTSPFVRKVRVLMQELGLAEKCEIVNLVTSPHEPDATLAEANPLVKLPTLELDDGTMLYDSAVICEYLDTVHGRGKFVPDSGVQRWRVLRMQALADGITDAGVLLRYELAMRPEEKRWEAWIAGQRQKVMQGLTQLEASLDRLEGELDLGGITVACMFGWLEFRNIVPELRHMFPHLSAWNDTTQKRPSLASTKPYA